MTRHTIPFPLRLLMQFLSTVLCLILVAGSLVTVLLFDVKALTSAGGIETILTALTTAGSTDQPAPTQPEAAAHRPVMLSTLTLPEGYTMDENGNVYDADGNFVYSIGQSDSQRPDGVEIPDDLTIPTNALTDPNALAEYIYQMAQKYMPDQFTATQEEVLEFLQDSTIMEYVSEKAASYVQDAINQEQTTTITTDEIMDLLEDNQPLIEEKFQLTVTDEVKENIRAEVDKAITEDDLNGTIQQTINEAMEQPLNGTGSLTLGKLAAWVGQLTQTKVLLAMVALCLVLVALLMAANFYYLPGGLGWAGTALLNSGVLLSLPLLVLRFFPSALTNIAPEAGQLLPTLAGAYDVLAPYHYGLAIFGLLTLVASFVWRTLCRSK